MHIITEASIDLQKALVWRMISSGLSCVFATRSRVLRRILEATNEQQKIKLGQAHKVSDVCRTARSIHLYIVAERWHTLC